MKHLIIFIFSFIFSLNSFGQEDWEKNWKPGEWYLNGIKQPQIGPNMEGFGDALPCAINVNCPIGYEYESIIKGVFWIDYATAFFVANTSQDSTPYFLTAKHLVDASMNVGDTAFFSVKFNYESKNCANPQSEPSGVVGTFPAVLRVKPVYSDIALLEFIGDSLPKIPIQMLGWDLRYYLIGNTFVSMGHPMADIKKMAFLETVYLNNFSIKGKVYQGNGAMQNGNSGSPLFDENLRVYGVVSGGNIYGCENPIQSEIIFMTLGYEWNLFKPYLDPLNTNTLFLNGFESALPVELVSFTSRISGKDIVLEWETATEVNNYGFEVERRSEKSWEKIGFVRGNGNSNSPKNYSFVDSSPEGGQNLSYRLKQIDNDGNFSYSSEVFISFVIEEYVLYQNYPNPFNPSTEIKYSIPKEGFVEIVVYDIIGNEIDTLVSEHKNPGNYKVIFDGKNLSSGIYIYRINSGNFVGVKKMMLLK